MSARVINRWVADGLIHVLLQHDAWPRYSFRLTHTAEGQLVGLDVGDPRAVARGKVGPAVMPHDADAHAPVSSKLIRKLPIAELETAARIHVRDTLGRLEVEISGTSPLLDDFTENKRPGRRGRGDRFYAALASEYLQLVASGTRRPTAELAARMFLSPSQVSNLLHRARTRGLLTSPQQGRAGGQLTPKAVALLRGAHGDAPTAR